ncbi:hypothetical protein CEQ90_15705 [Lewinellaceae bacterium SD302]|nr:hypothetical protein CEQ90_15705 [Lewinellaceae bacterium SD302]
MNKQIIFTLVSLVLTSFYTMALLGQHHDNIWLMSDINGGVKIDFSTGEPEVSAVDIPIIFENSSTSMSNSVGELQFYTNGCRIHHHEFDDMLNGTGINLGNIFSDFCVGPNAPYFGYPQLGHGAVSIPVPYHEEEYFLVHKPIDNFVDSDTLVGIWAFELLFSRIDMTKNDGLGRVMGKNIVVEVDSFESGHIALNKHANGEDWWLIQPMNFSNEYAIYLVDSLGVNQHSRVNIGLVDERATSALGQSLFSPNGDKYFRYNSIQGLRIFDFDRSTGELSNFIHISSPAGIQSEIQAGGVGVSPSGRYAYVSTRLDIYQYDLQAPDIAASRVHVAEITNPMDYIIHPTAFNFQLGPDCKLYVFNNSGISHHVIHEPDNPGQSCNFEQGGLVMPYPVFRDMPYFPNYRLGPLGDEGSPCADPLVSTTEQPVIEAESAFEVYPNPTYGPVTVEGKRERVTGLRVIDGFGRVLWQNKWPGGGSAKLSIDLGHLPNGLYTLEVTDDEDKVSTERLILQHQ